MATNPTADPSIALYNFYRRYLWTETDFDTWQKGMVHYSKGIQDGLFHGAVLQGLGFLSASGLNVQVDGGIAVGPTGNLLVLPATGSFGASGLLIAPTGAYPSRNLVVIRPLITPSTYITQPTSPNGNVPLQNLQQAQVLFLQGVAASSPAYPATGANDVVLFGVRLDAAATGFGNESIDLEVRDIPGKHSNFQQNFGKYDDRFRPYVAGLGSLGIKPSRLSYPTSPLAFGYVNKTNPSLFPRTAGGLFNNADTFLNFKTGAITGGDQFSVAFTPTIPAAGTWITALVTLSPSDQVTVAYGTAGTRSQCYTGIVNQVAAGAGCIPAFTSTQKPVAFVMLYSVDGTNITEMDFIDGRGFAATGAAGIGIAGNGFTSITTTFGITSAVAGQVLMANTNGGAFTANLPNPAISNGLIFTITDINGNFGTNALTLHRFAAEKIGGLAADFVMNAPYGSWSFFCDGTNWYIIA